MHFDVIHTLEHTGDTDDVPVYTAEQLRSYAEAARAPLLARIAEMERDAGRSFDGVCNRVARDLPEGYELRVCLDRGAGWVVLCNPAGDVIELPDASDQSIEQQIDTALQSQQGEAG